MPAELRERLVGVWRIVSVWREELATGRRVEQLGTAPLGLIIYTPSGHMSATLTSGERRSTDTDAERAAVHRSMVAYAGRYDVEGDAVLHRVEASWQPATVGTTFVRHVSFDGDTMTLRSPPGPSAMDGVAAVINVVWRREA